MSWEVKKPANRDLQDLPDNWEGITKENKVQMQIDVIEEQMRRVRKGTFDHSVGDQVAALILETQIELSTFFTDIEANAKNAKHIAEYIEAEVSNSVSGKEGEKKPSEAAIKRFALVSDQVKNAKADMVNYERDFKKWKCVYDILREAHIMFRNISKIS
jgi:hypothetical protein